MPLRLARFRAGRPDLVTLGAQGVVVNETSDVLLVRHGYRPGWHFPGGGVERGETIDRALCRELDEETGVTLVKPARLFGIYTNFDAFPGDHIALFIVEHWRQDRIPAANAEIAEQRFFPLGNLPSNVSPPAKRRLDEIFRGTERAHAW
jgi:ADP-ribose pyrophosphatase YjhB (NUDIX family)